MSAKKKTSARKNKNTVAKGLGALEQRVTDHVKRSDEKFGEIHESLKLVATKDDLSTVMLDQASKGDLNRLSRLLLTDEGLPTFATREDIEPIIAIYKGGVFTKGLVLGAAALIGAIVGIGWGILQLIHWFRAIH